MFAGTTYLSDSRRRLSAREARISERTRPSHLPRTASFFKAAVVFLLLLAPYLLIAINALAQTEPPDLNNTLPIHVGDGNHDPSLSKQAQSTDQTSQHYKTLPSTLVIQAAEQNKDSVVTDVTDKLKGSIGGQYNDIFWGVHQVWSDDIVSNLFANIGQLLGKWLSEFIDGWVADTAAFLTKYLRIFVLNPNIPVNGLNGLNGGGGVVDDISPYIRQAADVMYGIAIDLLLLLFILCIWKYWAEAAWRGGGNLMGAVGRLIFTAGLLLAWPTIYAFEIQIANEMIKAIYFNSADQVIMLDVAMQAAIKAGLVAGAAALANAFAPVILAAGGGAAAEGAGGLVLGTVGDAVSFAGLIIWSVLGVVLIAELIYFLVLKAIQTALLVAMYMFAPIFLVFFATPDTESVTAGFVKSFVEVSLWTFVWVGLLKIMVILLNSDFNPWGKIMLAVGILQLMIQVPSFLSRAQISPMSDFISTGLVTGFAMAGIKRLADGAGNKTAQLFNYGLTQQFAARGMQQTQNQAMNGLPTGAADPELLTNIRNAATGQPLSGQAGTGAQATQRGATPGLNTPGQPGNRPPGQALPGQAAPGLNTPGQASPNMAQADQQAAAVPAQGLPVAQPAVGAATPGTNSATFSAAALGLATGMARSISPAGVQRGMADPTLVAGTGEAVPADRFAEMLEGRFQHGEADSGVMNPATKFDHSGYKFVPIKNAAERARKFENNSIGYSSDGTNRLIGDGKGNLRHMRARQGASPEEVAHLVMAGGYAELFHDDPLAFDAARESAIESGADSPKGLFQRAAAGFMAYNGRSFKETAQAKQSFNRALFAQAAVGSEAYISGGQGNNYTQYLKNRFGEWGTNDDTRAVHWMTDASSPSSPWNPNYTPASDALYASGNPVTEANRAASGNAYVMRMPQWQRKAAMPAVAKYATDIADAQYPDADPLVLDAAVGRIATGLGKSEVEAIFAVQVESGGTDVSVPMVQTVALLSQDPRCRDANTAYLNLRSLMSSGRGGVRRRTVNVQAQVQPDNTQQPVAPDNVNIPSGSVAGQSVVEQNIDVEVRPGGGSGDSSATVQNITMQMPGGTTSNPQVYSNTRAVGGGGGADSTTRQNVQVEVRSDGGASTVPVSQGDLAGVAGAANTAPLHNAAYMMIDCYNAGITDQQMQDPNVAGLINHYYQDPGQRHMLSTVAVAARVLGNGNVNQNYVQTVQRMVSSGHSPSKIARPQIEAASDLCEYNYGNEPPIEPTYNTVQILLEHPGYSPLPGHRLSSAIINDLRARLSNSGRQAQNRGSNP